VDENKISRETTTDKTITHRSGLRKHQKKSKEKEEGKKGRGSYADLSQFETVPGRA